MADTITSSKYFAPDLIKDIQTDLERNGLPNLQILHDFIKDTSSRVLKRGKIKTLDEYYMIKELVVDLTTQLSDQQRMGLENYMEEFEVLKKKHNGA